MGPDLKAGDGLRFSVIIPTLGRPEVLRATLDSVAACDPPPDELIVVDGDETRSAEAATLSFEGRGFDVRYVASERGLTRQRNRAMGHATGDVIVFFDDDVTVTPEIFSILRREYSDPSVVGVTGRIIEPKQKRAVKKHSPIRRLIPGGGEEGRFTRYGFPRRLIDLDTARDIGFMHGSFMSVRTTVGREVRFDENLPGYGLAEDEDFSYRVARVGRVRYAPDAVVHHLKTGHGTRDARAFGKQLVGNRVYLFRKNFPQTRLARAQFGVLIAMLLVHRAINREWDELRGIADGARDLFFRKRDRAAAHPRVLFVSSHAKRGGSELYLERLLNELDESWIAGVVCLEDGPFAERLRSGGIEPIVLPTEAGRLALVRSGARLRKIIKMHAPSVVHANGIKAALVCSVATVAARVPVLWAKHDFSWDGRLGRMIARRSARIVGASNAVVESVRTVRPDAVVVIPIGIDHADVDRNKGRRALLDATGFPDAAEIIGVVGRLHPIKGQEDAIDLLARVCAERPDARLVLVGGSDPSEPHFEDALRRRVEERGVAHAVAFTGHRDDANLVMAGCDIGLVPTGGTTRRGRLREGFGLAAVEFMSVGTPVVAYADGALEEVVGSCGVLVPPGEVPAAAQAVSDLLADPSRRQELAACGTERARKLFSLDDMVRSMKDLYETMDADR